jgi:osmotically-inducible protein OsmY
MSPFEDDTVLSERHYNIGHRLLNKPSQFSRTLQKDFSGLGPSNYKRSDERIQDDSSDALYRCSEVDASDIEVSVKDGVVTLSGAVDSRIQKKVAEMTVERIPGVVDVDNRLVIERRGLVMDSPVP